ncbi:MAG: hypothetical protein HQK77_21340, partial [Desulfobacterales bacterium]|nr:hypothetical protein [Desulfobacterales bacterium]
MPSNKLKELLIKDPIIATFTAKELKENPQHVEEIYNVHALTHMSLGNIDKYYKEIIKWMKKNKGSLVGSIIGPYGYGKTSTGIYLWKECEKENLLTVPPFVFKNIDELISAIYGWVKYKIQKINPELAQQLESVYDLCMSKAMEKFVEDANDLRTIERLKKAGKIKDTADVSTFFNFIEDAYTIIVKAKFDGLLIFTDELQVTHQSYLTNDAFMNDLFGIVNGCLSKNINLGIIIGMPENTEASINDMRRDITQRLESRNVYIRMEIIYGERFPVELWDRYAHVFDFEDLKFKILDQETLESIGQISARKDLGAGPRSVIDAFINIINYYMKNNELFTPIDLINGYYDKKFTYTSEAKIYKILNSIFSNKIINASEEYKSLIKLICAFPKGCPEAIIEKYGLKTAFDSLINQVWGDIIIQNSFGYALALIQEQAASGQAPKFLRFVKNFANKFSENYDEITRAIKTFHISILKDGKKLLPPSSGLTGFKEIAKAKIIDKYVLRGEFEGSYSNKYPLRKLYIYLDFDYKKRVYDNVDNFSPENDFQANGINLLFNFYWNGDDIEESVTLIDKHIAVISFNLCKIVYEEINIPYLPDIFPKNRTTILFLLSLHCFLKENEDKLTNEERLTEFKVFLDKTLTVAFSMLLESLQNKTGFSSILNGDKLIEDLFIKMCEKIYPKYKTLMTSSSWATHLGYYIAALKDERLPLRIKRGLDVFDDTKESVLNVF